MQRLTVDEIVELATKGKTDGNIKLKANSNVVYALRRKEAIMHTSYYAQPMNRMKPNVPLSFKSRVWLID